MAALIARIPNPKERLSILHNLIEEHGEFKEDEFHHTTFQKFLASIGGSPPDLNSNPLSPEMRAFNSVLTTACTLDELEVGLGCMGIIEYAFSDISGLIGTACVENGWVKKENLAHYSLHASLDKEHARDFFVLLDKMWLKEEKRYFIEQGLRLGIYIFNRLYEDLIQTVQKNT